MPTNRQLFLQHLAQTSDSPLMLEIESANGIYLYDTSGKKYIDLISGIGVSNVGHRHPKVLEAIKNQLDKYLHLMVYGEYVQSPQVMLAKAIIETVPKPLESVYFLNSGSEAAEAALKLAKKFTGRREIIACKNAYHGSTQGALSACGNESLKQNFRPLIPGFKFIPFGDEEFLNQITTDTAAIIIETVQGEAGIRLAPQAYFQQLRKKCDQTNTLLILDEIQCGFGRTGKFWAFEHYQIKPDILISAKGMGGGMPISCLISSSEIMQVFSHDPVLGHISTFGGHPVSCAAALATLNLIQAENFYYAKEKEQLFHSKLKHQKIKEIRSLGLMLAIEFESFRELKPIIDKAIEFGIITDWFLFCENSMRIAPPLTISYNEIETACKEIINAISYFD